MRAARSGMRCDAVMVERGALKALIIVVRNTDEHADIASLFEVEDDARVLDCFPRCFEQQAMLPIDVGSFARGNAEKLQVELIDLVEEPAAYNESFSRNGRLAIVVSL